MYHEKFKENIGTAIENSEYFKDRKIQKNLAINRVNRALDYMQAERLLWDRISTCIYGSPIIHEVRQFDENLYIVFTSKDNYWRTVNLKKQNCFTEVSYTYEAQLLITLQNKYDGLNSQFSNFATRMLGDEFIKVQEDAYNEANKDK